MFVLSIKEDEEEDEEEWYGHCKRMATIFENIKDKRNAGVLNQQSFCEKVDQSAKLSTIIMNKYKART
jgi:hypothetical protein